MTYLENLRLTSPAYAVVMAGGTVPSPARRREELCLHRGRLIERLGTCQGNDLHQCDRFGSVVTHNGQCQTCPGYEADA